MVQGPELATFVPLVGGEFRVPGVGDNGLPLRLVGVDPLPAQPHAPRPEPFSLLFAGPATPILAQRTHLLRHPDLGSIELFLVPLGPGPDGEMLYECIFN